MREVDNKQIIKLHTVAIATGLPKGRRGASACGASPTSTTPGEAGGSQKGGWELSFTGRTSLQGDRWEAVQTESFLLTPSPKESLSRCGDFGILERDLQKHGLRTAIELSELTSSSGDGR